MSFCSIDMIEAEIASFHGMLEPLLPGVRERQRAKLTTPRWSISKGQLAQLSEIFKSVETPTLAMRQTIAEQMGVTPRQIQVWFRNRRQRQRFDKLHDSQSESALDSLEPLEAVPEGINEAGELSLENDVATEVTLDAAETLHGSDSERATSPALSDDSLSEVRSLSASCCGTQAAAGAALQLDEFGTSLISHFSASPRTDSHEKLKNRFAVFSDLTSLMSDRPSHSDVSKMSARIEPTVPSTPVNIPSSIGRPTLELPVQMQKRHNNVVQMRQEYGQPQLAKMELTTAQQVELAQVVQMQKQLLEMQTRLFQSMLSSSQGSQPLMPTPNHVVNIPSEASTAPASPIPVDSMPPAVVADDNLSQSLAFSLEDVLDIALM